jgi:hypothetical protein
MFEKSFIDLLNSDLELPSLLSTFPSTPNVSAIFSDSAPQNAIAPYMVFDIQKTSDENLAEASFDVNVDIYTNNMSSKILREIAERVEFICDRSHINNDDRFNTIRLYYENGGLIQDSDIKVKHYNMLISARGGRQKWTEQL